MRHVQFVQHLPDRLLAQPGPGGALVLGHEFAVWLYNDVDRTNADAAWPVWRQRHDAPEGWAREGDEARQLGLDLGMVPVVPPKANRLIKWDCDRTSCKRRNEVERLFRRLKSYRRIFSRVEKRDVMYRAFPKVAFIVDMIKCGHVLKTV